MKEGAPIELDRNRIIHTAVLWYRHRAVLLELTAKSAHTKGDDRQRIKERNGSTQKDAVNQAE